MANNKSTQFELDVETNIKSVDQIVKTVLANADSSTDRTTTITDLVAIVNDLRYMETDVLKFADNLGSYTPALATYVSTDKIYKGPIITGANASNKTAELVRITGVANTLLAFYTASNAKGIISNKKGVNQNTVMSKSGTYTGKEADILTKLAAVIALIPTLTTS